MLHEVLSHDQPSIPFHTRYDSLTKLPNAIMFRYSAALKTLCNIVEAR